MYVTLYTCMHVYTCIHVTYMHDYVLVIPFYKFIFCFIYLCIYIIYIITYLWI